MRLDPYIDYLASHGVRHPSIEVKKIAKHILGNEYDGFSSLLPSEVSDSNIKAIEALLEKRAQRIPSERLCGKTEFCDLVLEVSEDVFLPYPETERMIQYIIDSHSKELPWRILDLGTGSGCILLSLLHSLPNATGVGVDISETALALAKRNADQNGLADRAEFVCSNWGEGISEKFDIVVSNPPRVATQDIPSLSPEMKNFDPLHSLDGGVNGVRFFELSAERLDALAKESGTGFFQVGDKYAAHVRELFNKQGYPEISIHTNYLMRPAFMVARGVRKPKSRFLAFFVRLKNLWKLY